MPYIGPKIADHIDTSAGERTCRAIVHDVGERWHFVTAQNTPVRTGNLRTSWYRDPPVGANRTRSRGFLAFEVRIATDVSYAPHVEWDTRPHEIRPRPPRKALRFHDRFGNEVIVARVMHPGTKGQHMLAIGAHVVETTADQIAQPSIERWALAGERLWGSAGGFWNRG